MSDDQVLLRQAATDFILDLPGSNSGHINLSPQTAALVGFEAGAEWSRQQTAVHTAALEVTAQHAATFAKLAVAEELETLRAELQRLNNIILVSESATGALHMATKLQEYKSALEFYAYCTRSEFAKDEGQLASMALAKVPK